MSLCRRFGLSNCPKPNSGELPHRRSRDGSSRGSTRPAAAANSLRRSLSRSRLSAILQVHSVAYHVPFTMNVARQDPAQQTHRSIRYEPPDRVQSPHGNQAERRISRATPARLPSRKVTQRKVSRVPGGPGPRRRPPAPGRSLHVEGGFLRRYVESGVVSGSPGSSFGLFGVFVPCGLGVAGSPAGCCGGGSVLSGVTAGSGSWG
jgi:hypothetical protein